MSTVSITQQDKQTRSTITVAEAADLLGVSEWLVLKQIQQGQLPHKRFGRRILISRSRLLTWLEEQDPPADPPRTELDPFLGTLWVG